MAPMRPSIMSEGPRMSAPASAWLSAMRTSASTDSSLTISPSRTMPSWPSALKVSSATSLINATSGTAALMARKARLGRLSGSHAASHASVFKCASMEGNTQSAGIPRERASSAAATARSIVRRVTPGMEGTASSRSWPSITKIGQIRSCGLSRVSRTMSRSAGVRRTRRGRAMGKGAMVGRMGILAGGRAIIGGAPPRGNPAARRAWPRLGAAANVPRRCGGPRVDLYRTLLEVIDARSFSNLWYWLVLGASWSAATHYVLGVPWGLVERARHEGGQAEDDLHDVLRVHVLRLVALRGAAALTLLALASALLTALGLLGFAYGVEFAQASFLLAFPLSIVALLTLRTACELAAGRAQGDALYARLGRHRLVVRLLGMAAIFVTALVGMHHNLSFG